MTVPARRMALLVLVGLFLALTWRAGGARENESFGITPHPEERRGVNRLGFQIPREPGAIFEDAVKIYNRTDQMLPLVVYAADAEAADETITVGARKNEPKGVGTWIDLARNDIDLPPRGEVVVTFRVNVKSTDPSPNLGAIVVENTAPGLAAAQRLHLIVRTAPADASTTSQRVRPLLVRSPWAIVAILGLLLAIALVWVGTRRAKLAKDVLVPAGELEQLERIERDVPVVPEASRPVIKRLGVSEEPLRAERAATMVVDAPERTKPRSVEDDRPLLDDAFLVEVEPSDDEILRTDVTSEHERVRELVDDDISDEDELLEDELLDDELFEDEAADDDDDDEDLPPARHRRVSVRSKSASRTRARRKPVRKKPVRKKPTRKASVPRRKTGPKKKTASSRKRKVNAKTRKTTVRTASAKRNYIPLDDL